ncbi:MAG: sialate O-acetylesterase [Roseburia sp.]|nr:sialate O-acetylesterase [Roseburia sp.]
MYKLQKFLICAVAAVIASCAIGCNAGENSEKSQIKHLIVLCGQSNAVGYSHNEYLTGTEFESSLQGYETVEINKNYGEGANKYEKKMVSVVAGLGTSFAAFGPELGIAKAISESDYSGNTAIVKYAVGGTALDPKSGKWVGKTYWNASSAQFEDCASEGTLYSDLCSTVEFVIRTYEAKNCTPVIEAICWMQGENDAIAGCYSRYDSLEIEMVSDFRARFAAYAGADGIAFINAGISTFWKNYVELNDKKKASVSALGSAEYIDTVAMGLEYDKEPEEKPDGAHFDAVSMIKLGYEFGTRALKFF